MTDRLEELRTRARGMEAGVAEWDALLLELSRTPGPEEDVRARADVLRLIIEDPWLGGFAGSSGLRVDTAAAQALRTLLGEPSASTLPAPVQQAPAPLPEEPRTDSALSPGDWSARAGRVLALVAGLIELWLVVTEIEDGSFRGLFSGFVVCSTFLPALAPAPVRDSPWSLARHVGLALMFVASLGWAIIAFFVGLEGLVFSRSSDLLAQSVFLLAVQGLACFWLSRVPFADAPARPAASSPPRSRWRAPGLLGKGCALLIGCFGLVFVLAPDSESVSTRVLGVAFVLGATAVPALIPRTRRDDALARLRGVGMVFLGLFSAGLSLMALGILFDPREALLIRGLFVGLAVAGLTAFFSLYQAPFTDPPAPALPKDG